MNNFATANLLRGHLRLESTSLLKSATVSRFQILRLNLFKSCLKLLVFTRLVMETNQLPNQTTASAEWSKTNRQTRSSRCCFNAFISAGEREQPKVWGLSSLLFSLCLCQEAATGQCPISSAYHWLTLSRRTMKDIIKSNSAVYILY